MSKDEEMIEIEIDNCKRNIQFYKNEITNMENKINYLEKLKNNNEYY